jgi:hypothetical protein
LPLDLEDNYYIVTICLYRWVSDKAETPPGVNYAEGEIDEKKK